MHFQYFWIRTTDIQVNNILSAGHHLLGCFIAKADDTLQHALLVLDIILISQFQSLFQVINTQHMIFLLYNLFCKNSTFQQE